VGTAAIGRPPGSARQGFVKAETDAGEGIRVARFQVAPWQRKIVFLIRSYL
jgi:hypothetical protein